MNSASKALLFFSIFTLFSSSAIAQKVINVGGYVFAPFVSLDDFNKPSGITLDLIEELNKIQKKYFFRFVMTSPKRRYIAFNKNVFDMMLFESIHWGWKDFPVDFSKVYFKGGEVYITKKKPNRNNHFFNSINSKSLVIMRGYHYGFANFNADEAYLNKNFNVQITNSNKSTIELILMGRRDMGVVTKSYLDLYLLNNQDSAKELLISKKYDQEYNHTILLRKTLPVNIKEINDLLDKLKTQGTMKRVLGKYGIAY